VKLNAQDPAENSAVRVRNRGDGYDIRVKQSVLRRAAIKILIIPRKRPAESRGGFAHCRRDRRARTYVRTSVIHGDRKAHVCARYFRSSNTRGDSAAKINSRRVFALPRQFSRHLRDYGKCRKKPISFPPRLPPFLLWKFNEPYKDSRFYERRTFRQAHFNLPA
jgi:hypothetical protein